MDKIDSVKFKEYTVKDPSHRLELMMPYNDERGLRMYISGPPRCGKSYLIGQLIREYIRHYPKREIF
jgi:predicted AAA+ superfamily ATPase